MREDHLSLNGADPDDRDDFIITNSQIDRILGDPEPIVISPCDSDASFVTVSDASRESLTVPATEAPPVSLIQRNNLSI